MSGNQQSAKNIIILVVILALVLVFVDDALEQAS